MELTLSKFIEATGLPSETAKRWLDWFQYAIDKAQLNTPRRLAGFIAQALHETGNLRYLRELWGPTPTQLRYEGRSDLGNTFPGDGFKFRGRGIFQTTGRSNYAQAAQRLNIDALAHPELLEQPEWAMKSAILYWNTKRRKGLTLNQIIDTGDITELTRAINGGTTGLDDRKLKYTRALRALGKSS